MLMTICS